jgi:N-acetyl-anhydromuramyl-L-alanine amidase AmpD
MKVLNTPNISNYTTKKIGYVLHGTQGSYAGAVNWLMTPANERPVLSYSSAHYVISKLGEVTQLATPEQVTWHAGNVVNPTWRARKYLPTKSGIPMLAPFKNPNDSFVGIECEWFTGEELTEAQYGAIINIIKSNNIANPIILSHSEICDYKQDFGRDAKGMFPVQEIIRRLTKSN